MRRALLKLISAKSQQIKEVLSLTNRCVCLRIVGIDILVNRSGGVHGENVQRVRGLPISDSADLTPTIL